MTNANFPLAYAAADALAAWVLLGKVDKQGRPLIEHVRRVAARCEHLSEEQRLAALLHECVEDGDGRLTLRAIGEIFGDMVEQLVDDLTRRPSETYAEYIAAMCRSRSKALPVKLEDVNENLDEEHRPPLAEPERSSLRHRYLAARERILEALRTAPEARP